MNNTVTGKSLSRAFTQTLSGKSFSSGAEFRHLQKIKTFIFSVLSLGIYTAYTSWEVSAKREDLKYLSKELTQKILSTQVNKVDGSQQCQFTIEGVKYNLKQEKDAQQLILTIDGSAEHEIIKGTFADLKRGMLFSYRKLEQADHPTMSIQQFKFEGINLAGIDLTDEVFDHPTLLKVIQGSGDLTGTDIYVHGKSFSGVKMNGKTLKYLADRGADVRGADLSNEDVSDIALINIDLSDANLTNSTFNDCRLNGTTFKGANLTGAKFIKSNLEGASFENVTTNEKTEFVSLSGEKVEHAMCTGPSRAERYRLNMTPSKHIRETYRAPTEVTTHWIDVLEKAAHNTSDLDQQKIITELCKSHKQRWMKHDLKLSHTRAYLMNDAKLLRKHGLNDLSKFAESLLKDLPASSKDYHRTRMHDNVYGRAFESYYIANLVENPPKAVLQTMHQVGVGMADMFTDLTEQNQIHAIQLLQMAIRSDPRFWFDQTKNLEDFTTAKWPKSRALLLSILNGSITNGYQSLAISYISVNLFVAQRDAIDSSEESNLPFGGISKNSHTDWDNSKWMRDTDAYYVTMFEHPGRTSMQSDTDPYSHLPPVQSSGIGMRHHQPGNTYQSRPTDRPALHNIPEGSRATLYAWEHGIPYVSGVSGSTNIMLGITEHLIRNKKMSIDPKAALLGTMMFLNFDGGHSMHEALWTANFREPTTGLGLGLDRSQRVRRNPEKFVSDYSEFQNMFAKGSEIHTALADSERIAWENTLTYFNQTSYFASRSVSS